MRHNFENLTKPFEYARGTLGFCGTPVEKHYTRPWLSPFLNQQLITNNIKSSNKVFFCITARQNNDYANAPAPRDYANANSNDYVNAPRAAAHRDYTNENSNDYANAPAPVF